MENLETWIQVFLYKHGLVSPSAISDIEMIPIHTQLDHRSTFIIHVTLHASTALSLWRIRTLCSCERNGTVTGSTSCVMSNAAGYGHPKYGNNAVIVLTCSYSPSSSTSTFMATVFDSYRENALREYKVFRGISCLVAPGMRRQPSTGDGDHTIPCFALNFGHMAKEGRFS